MAQSGIELNISFTETELKKILLFFTPMLFNLQLTNALFFASHTKHIHSTEYLKPYQSKGMYSEETGIE